MKKLEWISLTGLTIVLVIWFVVFDGVFYSCSSSSHKSEENEKKFSEVVASGDFAEAHELLNNEIAERGSYDTDKIAANINLLYKAEAIDFMASDDESSQKKLILLLLEYPMLGEKVKEGLQRYSAYSEYGNIYNVSLANFNSLCDDLLATAITLKKYDLAKNIIDLYKEDCNIIYGEYEKKYKGVEVDGNHSYIEYSWDSKNAAKKKLAEALKNPK